MKRARLLILAFSDLSHDARVLKQIRAFAPNYEVTTCGYGPAIEGVADHVQLDDTWISWAYGRAELVTYQFRKAYWLNPAVRGAQDLLADREFDVILANDFETVPLALSLQPTRGVHADLHEYAPEQKNGGWKWNLFIRPFREWICRTYLPQCASTTTVNRGIAERYHQKFGINPGVVWNAAPYAELAPSEVHSPIRLVHHGAAHRDRKLETMAEAVLAAQADLTMDFYLVPVDPSYVAELSDRFADSPQIRILPPLPYDEIIPTINTYDVGLFTLEPTNFNFKMVLPNKLFDFIQARLGIIIGPSQEMAAVVKQFHNGAVTSSFSVESLAGALRRLRAEDVQRWKAASDAAARAASAELQVATWERAIAELAGV
ncbi:hypothetical protein [Scrofimicrobium sp. R131]|uniref:Glycosyltransferase n=1 Tax=Scrofimicrobium appendicitidis TaxID=3079930 RepID=A0AAU7V860_9ACTO